MPYSVDEATQRAEQLARKTHDAISEFRLEEAVGHLRKALAIREAYQGEAHPDLIWTLSLWIYALGRKHQPESALEAAHLGERRLALRRTALAGAPDELARSLRELIDLYIFEFDVLDTGRVDELRRELAALAEAGRSGKRPDEIYDAGVFQPWARLGSEASCRLSASDLVSYPWAEPLRIFEGG